MLFAPDNVRRLTLEELDDCYQLGVVDEETLVWTHGMLRWQTLAAVAGLDAATPAVDQGADTSAPSKRGPRSAPPPPPRRSKPPNRGTPRRGEMADAPAKFQPRVKLAPPSSAPSSLRQTRARSPSSPPAGRPATTPAREPTLLPPRLAMETLPVPLVRTVASAGTSSPIGASPPTGAPLGPESRTVTGVAASGTYPALPHSSEVVALPRATIAAGSPMAQPSQPEAAGASPVAAQSLLSRRPWPRRLALGLGALCGLLLSSYRSDLLLELARRSGREASFLELEQRWLGGPPRGTARGARALLRGRGSAGVPQGRDATRGSVVSVTAALRPRSEVRAAPSAPPSASRQAPSSSHQVRRRAQSAAEQ